jgi:hypothetical protein
VTLVLAQVVLLLLVGREPAAQACKLFQHKLLLSVPQVVRGNSIITIEALEPIY